MAPKAPGSNGNVRRHSIWITPFFYIRILFFPGQAEYYYYSADFRLKIFLWIFLSPGQTGNVWRPNIIKYCLVIKHFTVWPTCLMMFDGVWWCLIVFELIKHSIKQHQTYLLFSCLFGDVLFVWPSVSNMFGLQISSCWKLLWYSGWFCGPQLLAFGCLTMFDKTCLNRLARASNIKMFDHQTMFDDVWSSNISRLARALVFKLKKKLLW